MVKCCELFEHMLHLSGDIYRFLPGEVGVICGLSRDDFNFNLTKHVGILVTTFSKDTATRTFTVDPWGVWRLPL